MTYRSFTGLGVWMARVGCVLAAALLGAALGCGGYTPQPQVSSGAGTGSRIQGAPMCSGGERSKHCLFGERCSTTSSGCQVCVCESLED